MMSLNKIKAMLVERGIKQKEIAPRVKPRPVKPATVYVVINGHGRSRPVEETIAQILDVSYEEMWGEAA